MQTKRIPDWLFGIYQLLFLLLPWSVEADFGAWKLHLPAEPLIALAGIGLLLVLWRERVVPPVSALVWISLAWIVWQAVAAAFSSMPLVSWKYWLVEAGHWWVFFVGLLCWPEMWPRLVRLFSWSMAGVVLYTIVHHSMYHFRADQAMLAPMPFFADHTMSSVVLVLVLFVSCSGPNISLPERPILFKFQISNFKFQIRRNSQHREHPFYLKLEIGNWKFEKTFALKLIKLIAMGIGGGVAATALLLAPSRATLLSLLLSAIAGLALYFRPRLHWLLLATVFAVGAGIFIQEKISSRLANDVSSQERLNRYACALRMAEERPWMGFGPGTYQFQYLPFQKPEEMTRISQYKPIVKRGPDNYGRGGGAHSEYLQALAESGGPGLVLWLLLVFFSLRNGIRKFRQTGELQWLFLSLALLSFFLHGLVNNFLHDARVAALVWSVLGLSTVLSASLPSQSRSIPDQHRR